MRPISNTLRKHAFGKEKNKKDSINNNKKSISAVSNKENLIESRDASESASSNNISPSDQSNNNGEHKIIHLTKVGNNFFTNGDYEKAIETYMTALRMISSPVGTTNEESSSASDVMSSKSSLTNNSKFSIPSCNHGVATRLFLNIGAVHLKRNELDIAMKAFTTALDLSKQQDSISKNNDLNNFPECTTADALQDIALVYLKKDEFLLALDSFEKAKNIRVGALEAQNGTNIPKDKLKNAYAILCNLYSYIGMLNEWKGQYRDCIGAYHNALSSLQFVHGQINLEVAEILCKLGRVHCDLGCSYEEAMTCCVYALQIKNDLLGKSHIDVAKILTIIAEIHLLKKDHDDALTISNQAINIASSLESNDNENRLVVASALGIIGKSYERLDKLEDAMTNNKKALKIKVNVLGFEHPSVASTLRNIADIYCEDKRFEEAITMYTEALRMSNTPGNNNNKGLADTLNNLGTVHFTKGDYKEALSCHEKALELSKQHSYENHPLVGKTLRNIGVVLKELENREEAMECFRDALRIFRLAGFGVDHPDVTETIRCVANQWKT